MTRSHHHLPAVLRISPVALHHDLKSVSGFNAKVALLLTRLVGTMWCFWLFNGIALVSLPAVIGQGNLQPLIAWVSSNWIQLVLLPALMVGQNVQSAAADSRATRTFEDTERIIDLLDTHTQGGLERVIAELHASEARIVAGVPGFRNRQDQTAAE